MTRKRVLFVDDEPKILDSLRLLLRKQRASWEMVFVTDAEQALAKMREAPFDVIVSDLQMPRIDGATLLVRVTEEWPGTLRVILSGYADEAMLARARLVAHQCVSKPCEVDVLRAAIEQPGPANAPRDRTAEVEGPRSQGSGTA